MNATVDKWLDLIFPWRQSRLVEQVGGEIARQCRADLWRRVCRQIGGMGVAELRGYLRAYATDVVTAEADWALHRHRLGPAYRARAIEAGIDQLVALVLRDALRLTPRSTARPMAA